MDFGQLQAEVGKFENKMEKKVGILDFQQLQAEVESMKKTTENQDFAQLQAEVGKFESKMENKVGILDFKQLRAEVERVKRKVTHKAEIQDFERLQSEVGKTWKCVWLLSIIISLLTVRELWSFAPQPHGRVEQAEAVPAHHDSQKFGSGVCDSNSSLSGASFPSTYDGMSAFCQAAVDGEVELVKGILCNSDSSVANAVCFHETALLHAIGRNRTEVAIEMTNHFDVDVNILGQNENSALHEAVAEGNLQIAIALLSQQRFTRINHQNIGGFSPLGKVLQFSPPSYPQLTIARVIMEDPRFVLDPDEVLDLLDT